MIEKVSGPEDENAYIFFGHDPVTDISFGPVLVFSDHPDVDYLLAGRDEDTRACKAWMVACGAAKFEDIGRKEMDGVDKLIHPKQAN